MSKLLQSLFPQGQRKLLVSLIALAIGVALEKLGGGLSDNMQQSLIAIVAIFAGGNVMEHLADALKVFKGTKIGGIIEDVLPGDQGLRVLTPEEKAEEAHAAVQELGEVSNQSIDRMDEIEKKLAVQAQNMGQVVQILNQMRNPSGQTQAQATPQQPR